MAKAKTEKKPFSTDDIKHVIENWEKETSEELGRDLDRHPATIQYLVTAIRKAGYNLPRKTTSGLKQKVEDVLLELGLIKGK